MNEEHPTREGQESPGFSRGEQVNLRILVTGSRWLTGAAARAGIARAFIEVIAADERHLIVPGVVCGYPGPIVQWDQITVVHGAARGAVTIAARIATAWGMVVESHPVTDGDWRAPCRPECKPGHRRIGSRGLEYCPAAGNYQNARMVALGADVCLAFPAGASRGTRDCVRRAEAAGIPVRVIELLTVAS